MSKGIGGKGPSIGRGPGPGGPRGIGFGFGRVAKEDDQGEDNKKGPGKGLGLIRPGIAPPPILAAPQQPIVNAGQAVAPTAVTPAVTPENVPLPAALQPTDLVSAAQAQAAINKTDQFIAAVQQAGVANGVNVSPGAGLLGGQSPQPQQFGVVSPTGQITPLGANSPTTLLPAALANSGNLTPTTGRILDNNVFGSLQTGNTAGFIGSLAGNIQNSQNSATQQFLQLTG